MRRNNANNNANEILAPAKDGRAMILGRTGSGKSTLMSLLMKSYLTIHSDAKVLVVDSKPRFKAQWGTDGLKSEKHYRKWSRGEYLPGSFRLRNDKAIESELDTVWKSGGRVAIAQTVPGRIADLRWLEAVTSIFYGRYSDKQPRLVLVDELADFYAVQKGGSGIFWQIARSGRELNVALIAGSQRPAYIPKVILTEADKLYLFSLDYYEDIKAIWSMGVPREVRPPEQEHVFFYWNKFKRFHAPSGQQYIMEL